MSSVRSFSSKMLQVLSLTCVMRVIVAVAYEHSDVGMCRDVWMRVDVYMCVRERVLEVCVYLFVYNRMPVYLRLENVHTRVCVSVCACTHVSVYQCVRAHTCLCISACVHTHAPPPPCRRCHLLSPASVAGKWCVFPIPIVLLSHSPVKLHFIVALW